MRAGASFYEAVLGVEFSGGHRVLRGFMRRRVLQSSGVVGARRGWWRSCALVSCWTGGVGVIFWVPVLDYRLSFPFYLFSFCGDCGALFRCAVDLK